MNMFLTGLAADQQSGPYRPASSAQDAARQPAGAGLLCQAYMDDLAMFSQTAAQAQSQLNALDLFLEAYGMSLNASKCRHRGGQPHVRTPAAATPLRARHSRQRRGPRAHPAHQPDRHV